MTDSIVMVQAFAELRYGVVVHTRENSVKYVGAQFRPHTPCTVLWPTAHGVDGAPPVVYGIDLWICHQYASARRHPPPVYRHKR